MIFVDCIVYGFFDGNLEVHLNLKPKILDFSDFTYTELALLQCLRRTNFYSQIIVLILDCNF